MTSKKIQKRTLRRARVRAKISGTAKKPRLSVFRSNRHIYAQLIDDAAGLTLAQFSDLSEGKKIKSAKKIDSAKKVGEALGKKILEKGFKKIVFDRGGYKYHGRVKALAEGLRAAGVEF